MFYDSKEALYNYIKCETEEENIEIITDSDVYEVNYYDKDLKKKVSDIWNEIQNNNELILGVESYG